MTGVKLTSAFVHPHYGVAVCREARVELGDKVASQLKLTKDGSLVLWPQPTDDPEDPQNVSEMYLPEQHSFEKMDLCVVEQS